MQIKTKKVYYCDYCKKHSLRSLIKHEKHCTGNINRECRLCQLSDNYDMAQLVNNLKKRYRIIDRDGFQSIQWFNKVTTNELMDFVESCPACTLTLIRKLNPELHLFDFNYQMELEKWWSVHNESEDDF